LKRCVELQVSLQTWTLYQDYERYQLLSNYSCALMDKIDSCSHKLDCHLGLFSIDKTRLAYSRVATLSSPPSSNLLSQVGDLKYYGVEIDAESTSSSMNATSNPTRAEQIPPATSPGADPQPQVPPWRKSTRVYTEHPVLGVRYEDLPALGLLCLRLRARRMAWNLEETADAGSCYL